MKITASEEYGLRIILRAAKLLAGDADLVSLHDIADAEGISVENTAAILSKLREANLIESVRGKYGGYRLSRSPSNINLYQIIDALGGTSFGIDFCDSHSGIQENCANSSNCSVRPVWSTLNSLINNFLAGITLAELLSEESSARDSIKDQVITLSKIQMAYQ